MIKIFLVLLPVFFKINMNTCTVKINMNKMQIIH